MKKATLVSTHAKPTFEHDCDNCEFLGSLDGKDLYACQTERGVEYSARFGDEPHQYGSLGSFCPPESPYSLAAALLARRNAVSASFARFKIPCAWRTVGGEAKTPRRSLNGTRTVCGAWPLS